MFVHMYHTQNSQCPYIVSHAAICSSESQPVSLFNTLHVRLFAILILYACALQIIYIYINSI